MRLTEIAIRRPLLVSMALLFFVLLGAVSYTRLGLEQYPQASAPFVLVMTPYPGASPDEVESTLTKPLEDAVAGANDLKNLYSVSLDGFSIVGLEFRVGVQADLAAIDVERKVNAVRSQLPGEAKPSSIVKSELDSMPIMIVSLSGQGQDEQLRWLADEKVKPRLEAVRGVASVSIVGGREREIRVEVDQEKLKARGLSILQVQSALAQGNVSVPGGSLDENGQRYTVRYSSLLRSPEELGNLVLYSGPGGDVRLAAVSEVVDGFKRQDIIHRTDGIDSVGLVVTKAPGANTVQTAADARKVLQEVAKTLPADTKLSVPSDTSVFVRQSVEDIQSNLRDAVLLTGLVLLLFLHSFRSTLIVLLAIPTSLVSTLLAMWALGFTLNTMSMMAMALSIGILVDDSIVVLENIFRHLKLGESPWSAALKGRSEIGMAAIAITLVDVVVYVPIAFMSGLVGQFFREFGITVAVATLLSLMVSFTLTPMLASRWLKAESLEGGNGLMARFGRLWDRGYEHLKAIYRGLLIWSLGHRKTIVAVAAVTFLGALAMVPLRMVGTEFLPAEDQAELYLIAEMPPGTALDATNEVVRSLESKLGAVSGVTGFVATVGSGGSMTIGSAGSFSASESRYARINVKLEEKGRRGQSIARMAGELLKLGDDLPGLALRTVIPTMGMDHGQPFRARLKGDDPSQLRELGLQVASVLKGIPGAGQVTSSSALGSPEVRLEADHRRLADLGIPPAAAAAALRTNVEGAVATQLRLEGGDRIDVRIIGSDADRDTIAGLSRLPVAGTKGVVSRLDQGASLKMVEGPIQIERLNKQGMVTIGANISGRPLGDVVRDFQQAMKESPLPEGFSIDMGGDTEMMNDSFQALGGAILLSTILIYMLMVALYESFLYPLVIMFALPVSAVGALGALFLTDQTLNISSMIGMVMLMGLVGKNGILLVDYTNTLRARGIGRSEALVEAGPTRLRPILMTTATMVIAMIPVAFFAGPGAETRSPMAVAVIGGLISSTMLTLVLVPVMYTLLDDMRVPFGRRPKVVGGIPSTLSSQAPSVDGSAQVLGASGKTKSQHP